jgi:hypothetical protein
VRYLRIFSFASQSEGVDSRHRGSPYGICGGEMAMPIVGYADDINININVNIMGRSMQTVEKMHTEFEEQTETIRVRLILRKQKLWFSLEQI